MPELDKFRKEDSRVISLLSNCTFPDVLRIILNSVEPSRRQGMLSALWSTFANRESLAIIDMVPLIDVYHEAGVDFHGDTTVINRAVDTGDTEDVERLIEYGAELNATTEETGGDFNPLMYAVHNGDEIITKLLLENGAKPNLQNKKKETAILYALGSPIGSKECVRLLLEHGADNPLCLVMGDY